MSAKKIYTLSTWQAYITLPSWIRKRVQEKQKKHILGEYLIKTGKNTKSETHSAPERAMQKIYLDNLGRKKRTETEGFNGDLIYQDYVYDYIGNLFQTTAPYKSSEPILSNYSTYETGYTNQRISSTTTDVASMKSRKLR